MAIPTYRFSFLTLIALLLFGNVRATEFKFENHKPAIVVVIVKMEHETPDVTIKCSGMRDSSGKLWSNLGWSDIFEPIGKNWINKSWDCKHTVNKGELLKVLSFKKIRAEPNTTVNFYLSYSGKTRLGTCVLLANLENISISFTKAVSSEFVVESWMWQ